MTDPRQMARRLRDDLHGRGVSLTHGEALELVAHAYGARDWNTLAARPSPSATPAPAEGPAEGPAVPILRIFDRAKAVEFYVDYLGFRVDWEHGGQVDHSPLYVQASRGSAVLHLSEHHGDASPGGAALIPVADVEVLHRELHARDYDYAKPGIRDEDWGRVLVVIDPFHNRLVFHQALAAGVAPRPTEGAGPIEHDYELDCSVETAFDAFTRRIDEWWGRSYAPDGIERVEIEGREGGRAVMHRPDGTSYRWGTVTVWDPPGHYAQAFTMAQDTEHPSELDVRFTPRPGGCTMHFAHGGWDAANVAGRARFTEWTVLLDRFAALTRGESMVGRPG